MTHETPAQRRTRLIEQYAGLIYIESARHDFKYADTADFIREATRNAELLADAVIAATPQPEPQVDPAITAMHKAVWELSGVPDVLRGKTTTRYPSEIETRLVELCNDIINQTTPLAPDGEMPYYQRLAAIKRDMGVK